MLSEFLLLLSSALASLLACSDPAIPPVKRPNFMFIITDDQDLHLSSLSYQPSVQQHFGNQGTFFSKHYATVSLCCPSRVSLLTGKAAHNTNVTDVAAPYGGYPRFVELGHNNAYLPVWLQEAGYNTYYTGKLMNGHSTTTYNTPRAAGWNQSDFLIDPGTYVFYNTSMTRNNEMYKFFPGEYSTDLISKAAVGFLDDAIAAASERPFFLGVAPVPAKRHEHLFPNVTVPRRPNFNPEKPGTASYFKTLRQLNQTEIDYNDAWYRKRLQSLQSVNELIDSVMDRLSASPEVLENTYVLYTTDNGFHIGQHRLGPGKSCGIEEDVNIPFFIRGPGVAKAAVQNIPSSHTDIVPTLFHLAGIPLREEFDGGIMPVTESLLAQNAKNEHVNIEFWGNYLVEGNTFYGASSYLNNTYKTVRVVAREYDLAYTVWCTNEHQLYDMKNDPYQLTNLYGTNSTAVNNWPMNKLASRLNGLLLTLKRCKGRVCTRPWETLHPQGNVLSLEDAMDERYDVFYGESQHLVTYTECVMGQVLSVEGALEPVVWQDEWDSWSWAT